MYGIYLPTKLGVFLGQMLANIPAPWSIWVRIYSVWSYKVINQSSRKKIAIDLAPIYQWNFDIYLAPAC